MDTIACLFRCCCKDLLAMVEFCDKCELHKQFFSLDHLQISSINGLLTDCTIQPLSHRGSNFFAVGIDSLRCHMHGKSASLLDDHSSLSGFLPKLRP